MFSLIFSILYSVFNEHFLNLTFIKFCKHLIPLKCLQNSMILSPTGPTCWLDWVDSNHRPHAYQACALTTWATIHYRGLDLYGGDDGIRTHDPLLAGQVLSQLSYTPILRPFPISFQKILQNWTTNQKTSVLNRWLTTSCFCCSRFSIERRWSSRTFRYGYLVTT